MQLNGTCPNCGSTPDYSGRDLTAREKQLVSLIRKAMSNKEMAWELKLTEGTIKEYLFMIFKKTGVKNRTGLALWAIGNGYAS